MMSNHDKYPVVFGDLDYPVDGNVIPVCTETLAAVLERVGDIDEWREFWYCYLILALQSRSLDRDVWTVDQIVEFMRGVFDKRLLDALTLKHWFIQYQDEMPAGTTLLLMGIDTMFGSNTERCSRALNALFSIWMDIEHRCTGVQFKFSLQAGAETWDRLNFPNKSHLYGRIQK